MDIWRIDLETPLFIPAKSEAEALEVVRRDIRQLASAENLSHKARLGYWSLNPRHVVYDSDGGESVRDYLTEQMRDEANE